MFIKDLYSYNKVLSIGFMIFICAFAFLNYKKGAVAAPVYQYGMFSENFYLKDTQTLYRVFINGKPADLSDLNFLHRDIVLVSPEYYERSKERNPAVYESMKNIAGRFCSGKFSGSEKYTNNISDNAYFEWYKNIIRLIARMQPGITEVFTQKYLWDKYSLKPVSLPAKILYNGSH